MKTFIKKNIRFIIIVIICITCSVLTTFATTTLFNSSEVYYNNTTSGIQADKVQGAIDELYACASNYAAYNQRLISVENTIGNGSLTTTSQTLIGAVNEVNDNTVVKNSGGILIIKNNKIVVINANHNTSMTGGWVTVATDLPVPVNSGVARVTFPINNGFSWAWGWAWVDSDGNLKVIGMNSSAYIASGGYSFNYNLTYYTI